METKSTGEFILTFIEPEVLPACVADQIAAPAMRKFMCDNIDILPVLDTIGTELVKAKC